MATRAVKKMPPTPSLAPAVDPQLLRRVVVEGVLPQVDGGRFPIKRVVGEQVAVSADIHADGHDVLAAVVRYRAAQDTAADGWTEVSMVPLGNDRWQASFTVTRLGRYEYTVEGWVDRFETWRHGISAKVSAGQDVPSELIEGAALVSERVGSARASDPDAGPDLDVDRWLLEQAAVLGEPSADSGTRVTVAVSTGLRDAMKARADRRGGTRFDRVLEVVVERERARTGAWYEMFPRSQGPDPSRSATFDEAAGMLPYISAMGFDVLYLPPVHPIGRSFRKGPNNTLTPAAGDPGSPWAIGSTEGGHMAVEPGLGTIEDFDRFVDAAHRHGLEIALDIAFQASPDHPYVTEHPTWFRQRPDGTIKYAENPPKKYQDIYPINFESDDWQALWHELRQVIEFWIDHGVKIFRVDNPHTKPFRFWAWALAEIARAHPETIFLSEAFTRPKIMRYLAKCGFSQSYSYFTWRNTKEELTEYFTELTQTDVREYMRPNLFANTPDILHAYLQKGGRPAFQIRLVLAATLGASYGIYSGFELGENVPVKDGSEEYLDSEKYQLRPRNFDQPDSLAPLVRDINLIRRAHPALQHDWGLQFHQTDNPQILCYSKQSVDDTDIVLMVVNLDPAHMQHGFVQIPLSDWGVAPNAMVELFDLLSHERYFWRNEWNYVRLDPESRVAHILHVRLQPTDPH